MIEFSNQSSSMKMLNRNKILIKLKNNLKNMDHEIRKIEKFYLEKDPMELLSNIKSIKPKDLNEIVNIKIT
jgi:hypothetical protein